MNDAVDHYTRGFHDGYRAGAERGDDPTEPMLAFASVDDEPTRPTIPRMAGVHLGCYSLTVPQSVAWHSSDALERERIRADIRRSCRTMLTGQRLEHAVPIRDVDGRELERVTSVDLGPHRP